MSSSTTPGATAADQQTYYKSQIPPEVATILEAGAFRSLCAHLQDRSDEVQNIDLMTLSGFCRNCLAKWLVLEARKLSDELKHQEVGGSVGSALVDTIGSTKEKRTAIIQALDALGYDETAEEVYGCTYPEWKKRHAKKATDEQMEKYNNSKPLHATHDKSALVVRGEKPSSSVSAINTGPAISTTTNSGKAALLSNVCCEDVDNMRATGTSTFTSSAAATCLASPTPSAPSGGISLRIGILTVSDRAANNQYATGDLSGPAVEASLEKVVGEINAASAGVGSVSYSVVVKAIVPDEMDDIKRTLQQWSGKVEEEDSTSTCDIIITTGGTGFSPRDVTPEATQAVLDRESRGLMGWVSSECSASQPFAALSRGTCGTCGNTMIANLPGSPAGVKQVMQILFPLLVHAAKDIQAS